MTVNREPKAWAGATGIMQTKLTTEDYMDAFELADVIAEHSRLDRLYYEFFRVPALSMGLYVLPEGTADPQSPHTEDEVYYVVSGSGMVQVDGEDRAVTAGSIVYVGREASHRFHSITEDLTLLVVFAPARPSNPAAG